jgi:MoaD family protein
MKIRVNYFGLFRKEFRKRTEDVQLPNKSRLIDLLLCLAERYGEKFETYIFTPSDTDVKEDVLLNVNGVASRQLHGLETELNEGDEVAFMPLFSGGG